MNNKKLRGVFPIAPATFTGKGEYDFKEYGKAVKSILEDADGIALFGIAGEYYKLNGKEEERLLEETISLSKEEKKPVIISNTHHATEEAVRWARIIERAGADCMMVLPPFFLKPGAEELLNHMQRVSEAVSIPVMIQYAPEQTGLPFSPEILSNLHSSVPNACYFKIESKPPGHFISKLLELTDNNVEIFIGNAGFQLIEGLDRGGVGVMPGPSLSNIYSLIMKLYYDGKRESAIVLHRELVYFLNHIRQNVEMIIMCEKMILQRREILGKPGIRRPAYQLDSVDMAIFDELYLRLEEAKVKAEKEVIQ